MTKERKRKRFEEALLAARPELMRRARKHLPGSADDMVQEAYVLMLNSSRWEDVLNPAHWGLQFVDYIAANWSRKKERTEVSLAAHLHQASSCTDDGDIVERMIGDEETAAQVAQIMDAMGKADLTYREEYIILARLRDRTHDEIARTLGLKRESVAPQVKIVFEEKTVPVRTADVSGAPEDLA